MLKIITENLYALDTSLCIRIFHLNGKKAMDRIMWLASKLGDGYAYGIIGIGLAIWNFTSGLEILKTGLVAFAIELPLQRFLKHKIKRIRPCRLIPEISNKINLPDEFSFPSGHTAGAFLMATVLAATFPAWTVLYYGIATLIGISRIYNGVHYPGDVLAGFSLGMICANIGLWIV